MNKVLNEMAEILGMANELPKIDPTQPREVAGTFIMQGVTVIDEAILDSISELTWEQIASTAMLAMIGPSDFQSLISAVAESTPLFRETWNSVVDDSEVSKKLDRGSFVALVKRCPRTESCARYVYWCLNVLGEADEVTVNILAEKTPAVKMVIPTGQSKEQHDKNSNAADKYLGKDMIEPYEKPDKEAYMAKKLKQVKAAQDAMTKMAAKTGKAPDEVYPNLFSIDLARERARNS